MALANFRRRFHQMGLLDQVLGGVLNQATGGGAQAQDPLSSILGSVLGGGGAAGGAQGASPLLGIAMALVQQSGGIPGLLQKFQQAGLGQHADSWVGSGENQQLTPAQLTQALGHDTITAAATKAGVSHEEASTGLAQLLPSIINGLTPQGAVPGNHGDLLSQAMSMLGSR
jgi:uncharacterized protein YidB (DUF937 family)